MHQWVVRAVPPRFFPRSSKAKSGGGAEENDFFLKLLGSPFLIQVVISTST
jgi:hypothetical protein